MPKTKRTSHIEQVLQQEIRTALGKNPQAPLSIWIISKDMAEHLDVSALELLTSDPSLLVDLHYPPSGGLIVVINFAKCGSAELEEVIEAVATESGLPLVALA